MGMSVWLERRERDQRSGMSLMMKDLAHFLFRRMLFFLRASESHCRVLSRGVNKSFI